MARAGSALPRPESPCPRRRAPRRSSTSTASGTSRPRRRPQARSGIRRCSSSTWASSRAWPTGSIGSGTPVPLHDVRPGRRFRRRHRRGPTGEFSARAVRAAWNPTGRARAHPASRLRRAGRARSRRPTASARSHCARLHRHRREDARRRRRSPNAMSQFSGPLDRVARVSGAHVRRIQAQRYGARAAPSRRSSASCPSRCASG